MLFCDSSQASARKSVLVLTLLEAEETGVRAIRCTYDDAPWRNFLDLEIKFIQCRGVL
jgi:hypothetical protein